MPSSLLSTTPRAAAATADLPVDSAGNDCSSCVFRHSGNRAVRFIADSRAAISLPNRSGIYERTRRSRGRFRKVQRCAPRHAPLEAAPGIILLIKADSSADQTIAMWSLFLSRTPSDCGRKIRGRIPDDTARRIYPVNSHESETSTFRRTHERRVALKRYTESCVYSIGFARGREATILKFHFHYNYHER